MHCNNPACRHCKVDMDLVRAGDRKAWVCTHPDPRISANNVFRVPVCVSYEPLLPGLSQLKKEERQGEG